MVQERGVQRDLQDGKSIRDLVACRNLAGCYRCSHGQGKFRSCTSFGILHRGGKSLT